MTVYKMADLPQWVTKVGKVLDATVSRATDRMITRASATATGVTRGGSVKPGFVPRADGNLANSLVSQLYGSTVLQAEGEESYALIVNSMKGGDVATFAWTSEYAARRHYWFTGTDSKGRKYNEPGWHWVDKAIPHWQGDVDAAVAEVKAEIR